MKFFINDTDQIVNESIDGLLTNPRLAKLDRFPEVRVVVRKYWDKSKVAIISGGGSGHEPAHAALVGKGLLTAAVCGDIFASPSVDAVLSAILSVNGEAGTLLIIKNYTGDRINFGLAAEQARALGHRVKTVIVDDDVALGRDISRRGLVGTLYAQKVAGYLSEEGRSLEDITQIVQEVIDQTFSISLSLTECQLPGQQLHERLKEDEAELGLGIHGEPGIEVTPYSNADHLVGITTQKLQDSLPDAKARFALIVNNMGGVSPLEMGVLVNAFRKTKLAEQVDYMTGPATLMSSINMVGFSLSLLQLTPEIEKALLAYAEPPAWHISRFRLPAQVESPVLPDILQYPASENESTRILIEKIASLIVSIEADINTLDAKVGDGDAGSTFAVAGKKILAVLDKLPLKDNGKLLLTIGRLLARDTGGSSGVLLSILFTAAGNAYTEQPELGQALLSGLQKMKSLGGANIGDRTMIDALEPAFLAIANKQKKNKMATEARKGADSTKAIYRTNFGRSSYLSESTLKDNPDPGAEVVARIFECVANGSAE